jgi:hypothetical protein
MPLEHIPFGSFNPRFYGVSVFLSDHGRLDAMHRYVATEDVGKYATNSVPASFDEISTLSVIDHETRHFHDFLISPLGTSMMGLRMQASINGIQAFKAIKRSLGRYVPVPIGRWMQWNNATRQQWVESTGKYCGITRLDDMVALPNVTDPLPMSVSTGAHPLPDSISPEHELKLYAQLCSGAYSSMSDWRSHRVSDTGVQVGADDVFETLAHLVQLQSVWTGQGEEPGKVFLRFILTSPALHLHPIQVLWEALKRAPEPVSIRRLIELVMWTLLGPEQKLRSDGHPAFRFSQLLVLAVTSPDHVVFVEKLPTRRLFELLDTMTETCGWEENIRTAEASADQRIELYRRASQQVSGGYFDSLFAVAEVWHQDQHAARRTFLEDPESITNPLRYLTERAYPLPYVETRLGSMIHERTAPLGVDNSRAIAVDDDGKRVISYISCLSTPKTIDSLDNVVSARLSTHLVDWLFVDEPTVDGYEEYWRSRLETILGKEIVSVY